MASTSSARQALRLCARCELQAQRASYTTLSSRPAAAAAAAILSSSCSSSSKSIFQPSRSPFSQASFSTTANIRQSNTADASPKPASAAAANIPKTHYDLFPETLPDGPPPSGHFPINTRALRREFLRLQARAHPDMHPPEHKPRAEATSALINEAYKTLSNPLLRAQYILSLRGVDVANDETLKVEEPDLLMLVLETREEIEDAVEEEDLEEPRRLNDERIAASEEILDQSFAKDDIEAAKKEAVRLRYWVNIRESLDNWEKGRPIVLEH